MYTPTEWKARAGTGLDRFAKTNEDAGHVTLTNDPTSITEEGTPFSIVAMNKIERGIEQAHQIATPLSDRNRVFAINGNGIPMLPDNVAGVAYRSNWTTGLDLWFSDDSTIAVENQMLKVSQTSGSTTCKRDMYVSDKQIRIIAKSSVSGTLSLRAVVNGVYTPLKNISCVSGVWVEFDCMLPANTQLLHFVQDTPATIYISSACVGSGLYDTPVYGIDGKSVWANHGVVPVPGKRGKAMLFQGKQYLKGNDSFIGLICTIPLRINAGAFTSTQWLLSNIGMSPIAGIYLQRDSATSYKIVVFSGGEHDGTPFTLSNESSLVITKNDNVYTIYVDGIFLRTETIGPVGVVGSANLHIGINSYDLTGGFNGTIETPGCFAGLWSADEAMRYHNGDDSVDCQQKSATGVPNALAVFANDGFLGEHGTFTPELKFGGNNVGMTYVSRTGYFNRIGKMVFVHAMISLQAKGSSTGYAQITGYPFNPATYLLQQPLSLFSGYINHNGTICATIASDDGLIINNVTDAGVISTLTESNFIDSSLMRISGWYIID